MPGCHICKQLTSCQQTSGLSSLSSCAQRPLDSCTIQPSAPQLDGIAAPAGRRAAYRALPIHGPRST